MQHCNHLRHLNTPPMYPPQRLCLSTRAAIFAATVGEFQLKLLCERLSQSVCCCVRCVVIFLLWKLVSAEDLHSAWPLVTTTPSHCRFPLLLMSPLFSNFRQWRENVTEPPNENQLGCACCSQSVSVSLNWVSDGGFALSRVPVLHM